MKRPKLADMTIDQECRWRLLQGRRAAKRMLVRIASIENPNGLPADLAEQCRNNEARARTIIAITKPAWVRKAKLSEVIATLRYLSGEMH